MKTIGFIFLLIIIILITTTVLDLEEARQDNEIIQNSVKILDIIKEPFKNRGLILQKRFKEKITKEQEELTSRVQEKIDAKIEEAVESLIDTILPQNKDSRELTTE